ncbi:hypothetical protein D3C86_2118840 [compost metagenome]
MLAIKGFVANPFLADVWWVKNCEVIGRFAGGEEIVGAADLAFEGGVKAFGGANSAHLRIDVERVQLYSGRASAREYGGKSEGAYARI